MQKGRGRDVPIHGWRSPRFLIRKHCRNQSLRCSTPSNSELFLHLRRRRGKAERSTCPRTTTSTARTTGPQQSDAKSSFLPVPVARDYISDLSVQCGHWARQPRRLDHDVSNFVRMFERSEMPRLRQRDLPASLHQLRNLVSLLRLRPIMVPINQRNGDVYPRIEPASRDIARQRTEVTAFHVRKAGSAATSELLGKKVFGELARVKNPPRITPRRMRAFSNLEGSNPRTGIRSALMAIEAMRLARS